MSAHVFVSYVREDDAQVDRICDVLQAAGVSVWRDKESIAPGSRWQDAIRRAIGEGSYFLACFSQHYWQRNASYMNTELGIAIQALEQRRSDQVWFIPVRLDDCAVPDRRIGPGETLGDLQRVDLFRDFAGGMRRVLAVIAPFASDAFRDDARRWVAEEFRVNRALQVYDEWHSPLMHRSRILASNVVESVKDGRFGHVPTLSAFELAQRQPGELSAYADAVFRVVHFFERWALLRVEGLLEPGLAARLLGGYTRWYAARLLGPMAAGEHNPDFVELLRLIGGLTTSPELRDQSAVRDPAADEPLAEAEEHEGGGSG